MGIFNFANLRQTPQAATPKAMEDEDQVDPAAMEDEDETVAESDEDETVAEDGDPAEDDEEMTPAEAKAFRRGLARGEKRGRRAEKKRCAAILAAAAPHTVAVAANLAFNTDVSPKAAASTLAAIPASDTLAARMAARSKPAVPAAGGGREKSGVLAARMARLVKKEG